MSFSIVLPTLWPYITDVCFFWGGEGGERGGWGVRGEGGGRKKKKKKKKKEKEKKRKKKVRRLKKIFYRTEKIINMENILDGH